MGRRKPGQLTVEQTRDLLRVEAMLARAGMVTHGLGWPAGCYLMAFVGEEPVGVVGIEVKLDAALVRSLFVEEGSRRRGVGTALVAAARKAAHARGARELYVLGAEACGYFRRFGFEPVSASEVMAALSGTPLVEYWRRQPSRPGFEAGLRLDISRDGVIDR